MEICEAVLAIYIGVHGLESMLEEISVQVLKESLIPIRSSFS
jgi:hypothetical protein